MWAPNRNLRGLSLPYAGEALVIKALNVVAIEAFVTEARHTTSPRPLWAGSGNGWRMSRIAPATCARGNRPARSPLCLVEQGYGVCGTRDERPHTGQQQQLVDQVGHDGPPQEWLRQNHNWEQERWFRDGILFIAVGGLRCAAIQRAAAPGSAHSITSSARASSVGGMSRANALAVLRLTTNSNLVGCSTGRAEALAPFNIRST